MNNVNESVDAKISNTKFDMISDKRAQDINPKDIIKINVDNTGPLKLLLE